MQKVEYQSDSEIVALIRGGQRSAAGMLYEKYKRMLYAFFYNYSANIQQSEDLVQMTFEKVLKNLPNYKGSGSLKSWIFTIARNMHVDYHRKNQRLKIRSLEDNDANHSTVQSSMESSDQTHYDIMKMAINQLPGDKRELLIMTKLKGMKYREVGEIYGLPEGTIKVRMCRIMQELKTISHQLAQQYQI